MFGLMTIFIVLYIIAIIFFDRRLLEGRYLIIKNELELGKKSLESLARQERDILSKMMNLEAELSKIFALYEITKHIAKALKEDEALSIFKAEINQYLKFEDCKLLNRQADISPLKDYFIQDLNAGKRVMGSLAIKGLPEEDKERFNILAQQFALGLRRIRLYEKIEELAITDSLTHLFTRRYSLERLNEEFFRAVNQKLNLSFLMIDVDDFKSYNDKYGHQVGDVILKEIASVIKLSIREIDLLGRFGGEEFICILPETSKEGANFAAERIREAIEAKEIKAYDEVLKTTISIGLATFPNDASSPAELIDKSDWALYRAKKMGKNRVCSFAVFNEH
jgi:diguanylate cyclase (GGDEF)-like protein